MRDGLERRNFRLLTRYRGADCARTTRMTADATPAADSALVLLDFQFDFLDDKGRMPVARAHVEPAVAAARRAVELFLAHGRPVAAVGNAFRRSDAVMNLLRRHASIEGSRGAEWDKRIPLAGLTYFTKWSSSAFVNSEFEAWLRREGVNEIALGGLFARACVTATARDAIKRGFRVRLIECAIACASDRSRGRALGRLQRAGATLLA
jgi:nicotinamidase-related amidase